MSDDTAVVDATPAAESPPVGRVRGAIESALRRLAGRARRVTIWQAMFALMVWAYVVYFTKVSVDVHNGLGTSSYDVGLYQQGVWLLGQGEAPFVTLMGRNMLGDHASFILILVAPIYRLFPAADTLFFLQSLFIGLGALPIFLAARKRLASEAMAFVLAACFLLHPAVGWTNRENYHPDSFVAFFLGMAIYGALERKWRLYWVFVILTLMVKEDVVLVVLPLAVWVAVYRDRRFGKLTAMATIAATIVGMFVVMRSLIGVPTRNAWRIPFNGPTGVLREVVERPGNVIEHFRSDNRPFYFWQMVFPSALVFLRRPALAAVSLLVLSTNMLSTFWYQYHIEYHYSLIAVPAIVLGTVYALELFGRRWRRWLLGAVGVASLWSCLMWGVVPIGQLLPPGTDDPIGRELPYYWTPDHPVAEAARSIADEVPDDASLSTYHSMVPHVAHRKLIYQFPNPFRVVLYGPDTSMEAAQACLPEANDLEYVLLQKSLAADLQLEWDRVSVDFEQVAGNEYWTLYERVGHSVQCQLLPGQQYPQLVDVVG